MSISYVDVKEMNFVAQNVPELACQNLVKLEPKVWNQSMWLIALPSLLFSTLLYLIIMLLTGFYSGLIGKRRNRLYLWQVFFANPSEWWDNRNSKMKGRAPDFRHKDTGEALWINDNDPPWINQQLQLHDSRSTQRRYRPDRGLVSLVPFAKKNLEVDWITDIADDDELAYAAEGQQGIGVFKDRVIPVGNPHCFMIVVCGLIGFKGEEAVERMS
ncbi:hypothetical protein SASPL_135579 [Salvia splendens]|uniref:Uncharacterized protein n=1 Tax=Salvia splendens TaxID=180675 RepID=A0A8X8ZFU7_SALSN|nr:hypothetical protein SASPL_135579 [Salvia splendens]